MVLEDIDSPDSFSDDGNPTSNDAYDNQHQYRIDTGPLHKPIPLPFLGLSKSAMQLKSQVILQHTAHLAGRRLTPEEAQQIAAHVYTRETRKSFLAAGAGLCGILQWWNTMKSNKYPFYQPKEVDPNKFWLIRGPWASYFRHSWRLTLYFVVATQVGETVAQLVRFPTDQKEMADDPKLQELWAATKASAPSRKAARDSMGAMEYLRARKAAIDALKEDRPPPNRMGGNVGRSGDDMSPTADNDSWPASSDHSWGSSTISSDPTQSSPNEPSMQSPSQSPRAWGGRPPPSQQPPQSDDDASPTGGYFRHETPNSSDDSGPADSAGGSAWDRLRRGGSLPPIQRPPQPGRPPHRVQREESTVGDSFTFAASDEERQRAQAQAQREFDERIEKERQGKDFNDNEKRW